MRKQHRLGRATHVVDRASRCTAANARSQGRSGPYLVFGVFVVAVLGLSWFALQRPDVSEQPLAVDPPPDSAGRPAARDVWPAPNHAEAAAIQKGRDVGIGSVSLEGPAVVEVMSQQTWTLRYQAGKAGVASGGRVVLGLRHLQNRSAMPQCKDPTAPNYCSVVVPSDRSAQIDVPRPRLGFARFHPWQNLIVVTVSEPGLRPGEELRVVVGDRSGGSPGFQVQPYDETHYGFKVYVDERGNGDFLPLGPTPFVEIIAAPPARLAVVTPSDAQVGVPTWVLVRAEDRYGNPAPAYRGTVQLSGPGVAGVVQPRTFTEDDRAAVRIPVVLGSPGVHSLAVADGALTATSNPIQVHASEASERLLWGDLHGHSLFSDGRGTVEEFYDFAERVAGLDFCALTDHAFTVRDEMWEHSKEVTRRLNRPGEFVTFQAYEWSGATHVGGDHNVFFLDDDPPLIRSGFQYDPNNLQMHWKATEHAHVTQVFAELATMNAAATDVFCIPHWGGRRANPEYHDVGTQRLIEVFSEHGRKMEWASDFLARGYRLGFVASTDGHYGNPGHGYLKPNMADMKQQEVGMAAVAVLAPKLDRSSIFHALRARRCYATTGDRIILSFAAGQHPMGSEFRATTAPQLRIRVHGTAMIDRVVVRNTRGEQLHSVAGSGNVVTLDWTDPQFSTDRSHGYYVHVTQSNGEEAVSSPIWVN